MISARTIERRAPWRNLAIGVTVAVLLVAAGCGSDDKAPATTVATSVPSTASLLPPTIVDLATVGGTTVDVRLGGAVDMTTDETVTDWTATIADPTIVSFVPGRVDATATFNPGLMATAAGSTEVTMTNGATGDTATFTVVVS